MEVEEVLFDSWELIKDFNAEGSLGFTLTVTVRATDADSESKTSAVALTV